MIDRLRVRAWSKQLQRYCNIDEMPVSSLAESNIDLIIEQCTGMKDEDGKPIYEGDIVECFFDYFDGNFSEKRVVGPVVWYAASWNVEEKGNHWYLIDASFDEKNLQSDYVKIIGNIHENPELLECK